MLMNELCKGMTKKVKRKKTIKTVTIFLKTL